MNIADRIPEVSPKEEETKGQRDEETEGENRSSVPQRGVTCAPLLRSHAATR